MFRGLLADRCCECHLASNWAILSDWIAQVSPLMDTVGTHARLHQQSYSTVGNLFSCHNSLWPYSALVWPRHNESPWSGQKKLLDPQIEDTSNSTAIRASILMATQLNILKILLEGRPSSLTSQLTVPMSVLLGSTCRRLFTCWNGLQKPRAQMARPSALNGIDKIEAGLRLPQPSELLGQLGQKRHGHKTKINY